MIELINVKLVIGGVLYFRIPKLDEEASLCVYANKIFNSAKQCLFAQQCSASTIALTYKLRKLIQYVILILKNIQSDSILQDSTTKLKHDRININFYVFQVKHTSHETEALPPIQTVINLIINNYTFNIYNLNAKREIIH